MALFFQLSHAVRSTRYAIRDNWLCFFKFRFRSTQYDELGTNKLALFFQLTYRSTKNEKIGFVFSAFPRNTQHASHKTNKLALFFQKGSQLQRHRGTKEQCHCEVRRAVAIFWIINKTHLIPFKIGFVFCSFKAYKF